MSRAPGSKSPRAGAVPLGRPAPPAEDVGGAWVSRDTVPLRQGTERVDLDERSARLRLILGRRYRPR